MLSSIFLFTIVSLKDVFLSEAGSKEKRGYLDLLEVKNYVYSLDFALDQLSKGKRVSESFK